MAARTVVSALLSGRRVGRRVHRAARRPSCTTTSTTGTSAHHERRSAAGPDGARSKSRRRRFPRLRPVPQTYFIRTFGCQMNEHDSERLAGLLVADGLGRPPPWRTPTSWCSTRAASGRTPTSGSTGPGTAQGAGRRQAGPADRGRGVPGPEGPRAHPGEGGMGRRRLRHAQPGERAGAAAAVPGPRARHGDPRRPGARVRVRTRCSAPARSASCPTPRGSTSRPGATTRAPSASCRRCAGPR